LIVVAASLAADCALVGRAVTVSRDKVLETCKGKQGAVLQQCMREEYKKLPPLK